MIRFLSVLSCCWFLAIAVPSLADVIRVASGDSIAEALEEAPPGSIIEVEPGIYHEALSVDTPGITLRGLVRGSQRPILDGRNKLNDGVIASGSPFTMSGFGIRHYKGNGVSTQGVDGVTLTDLEIDDTGLYGVYPVQSRNVVVTHCTITRIKDAGIYVGESERALVAYNEVHHNVAGIEIENTNDAEVRDNLAFENTAGILVFVLPGKVLKEARRNRVHRNWVVRNNHENFGDPAAIVGQLPPGIGILVMGADGTVVENNRVKDNGSIGIGLIRLAADEAARDPEQEPLAEGNQIRGNYLSGNGLDPDPSVVEGYGGGGDFAWDGTGRDNCVDLADSDVIAGIPLRGCSVLMPDGAGREFLFGRDLAAAPSTRGYRPAPAAKRVVQSAAADADLDAVDQVVKIRAMRFEPKHVTIRAGETVAWLNEDAVAHTITSGEGRMPTHSPMSSPFMMRGATFSHAFAEPGRYEYLCMPHLDQAEMREATVTVLPPDA